MAKVLWVLEGDLYTDPVTGLVSFHPPFYHMLLSLFVRLGCSIDHILLVISVFNAGALFIAVFLIIRKRLNDNIAIFTVLLLPFIINYMGHGNFYLATAFSFSLPIYLLGLRVYLSRPPTRKTDIFTSICWGAAFLISPVYVILIGCTIGYELIWKRDIRRFGILAGVFLITISPFFIQVFEVSRAGMPKTATFSAWRGFPDIEMIKRALVYFLSPVANSVITWQPIISVALFSLGIISIIRNRPIFAYPVIVFIAYILTSYHFSPQYAIRIHFIMSFIIVGYAVWYLISFRHYRKIIIPILLVLVAYGAFDHFHQTYKLLKVKSGYYQGLIISRTQLWNNLDEFFVKGERILATDETYRIFILPRFPVHALSAWRTAAYFQINQEIAVSLEKDYKKLMGSSSIHYINHICEKHSIRKCLIMKDVDAEVPALRVIARKWQLVYEDDFFVLYEII
jgi:hypothetical protein